MMRYRTVILYWLMILVPTLAISVGALRLLRHERERLLLRERQALEAQAQTLAERLRHTVADIQSDILVALRREAAAKDPDTLGAWCRRHPLIRHGFVWRGEAGLVDPMDAADADTMGWKGFLRRYTALLDGTVPWDGHSPDSEGALPDGALPPGADRSGWLAWFEENRLCLVGWYSPDALATVFGVELEMTALMARLVTRFPAPPDRMTFRLLDGRGEVTHHAGLAVDSGRAPDAVAVLAPELPHWRIIAYLPTGSGSGAAVSLLGYGLLLGSFVFGIVVGGVLLTWQALRNARDARRKTSFVSNVSHELKTPLTSIRMYAELLKEGRVTDAKKRNRYLDVIAAESQRLTRLVNNMLDFSRLEQGRKRFRPERLDVVDQLRAFADSQTLRLREMGMTPVLDLPSAPLEVSTDRDALEQALLNLVDNAIKYAADGRELALGVAQHAEGHIVVRVMDRGPGLPGSRDAAMFEQFRRGDDSLTAEQPGSGLGLSIARDLMRAQGGDVRYRPREGGGSCFEVLL